MRRATRGGTLSPSRDSQPEEAKSDRATAERSTGPVSTQSLEHSSLATRGQLDDDSNYRTGKGAGERQALARQSSLSL